MVTSRTSVTLSTIETMTWQVSAQLQRFFDTAPGCWGCKDANSVFLYVNTTYAASIGLTGCDDAIGRTDADMPCDTALCADLFRAQDGEVMRAGKPLRILDVHRFAGREWRAYIYDKTPLYDARKIIVGTIFHGLDITSGATLELGSLLGRVYAESANRGLQSPTSYMISRDCGRIKLTDREAEVLFFLIRGKVTKKIAQILKISPRTVETHVDGLKAKFGAASQPELIDKAIQLGYLKLVPQTLFTQQLSVVLRG